LYVYVLNSGSVQNLLKARYVKGAQDILADRRDFRGISCILLVVLPESELSYIKGCMLYEFQLY
jgi:hypothetical protein